jgi:hypothetical protein
MNLVSETKVMASVSHSSLSPLKKISKVIRATKFSGVLLDLS